MAMKILVIDIGGTNVKMLASEHENPRKFPSGRELTPEQMVAGVLAATKDWDYEAVSIGFPGPVLCGLPMTEPSILVPRGWVLIRGGLPPSRQPEKGTSPVAAGQYFFRGQLGGP